MRPCTFLGYEYDAADRLIKEIKKRTTASNRIKTQFEFQYTYDAAGNRLSFRKNITMERFWEGASSWIPESVKQVLIAAGFGPQTLPGRQAGDPDQPLSLVKTYVYDQDNRLLNWTFDVEAGVKKFPIKTVQYAYDNNGNRIQKERRKVGAVNNFRAQYSYDFENRLTGLEYFNRRHPGGITMARFGYDGYGKRVSAVEGDEVTKYFYDGLEVVLERDGTSAPGQPAGRPRRSYTRALGFPGGIAGLIAMKKFI